MEKYRLLHKHTFYYNIDLGWGRTALENIHNSMRTDMGKTVLGDDCDDKILLFTDEKILILSRSTLVMSQKKTS